MRTFERTHPWLTFKADLRAASIELWLLLGECQSKCEQVAQVPLRPDTAQMLYHMHLAKGVHATTAIEGNTLSEEEVAKHLEGKLELPPSRRYLQQEIDNIVQGCSLIFERIAGGGGTELSADEILELNRIVLDKLDVAEEAVPGHLREYSVGVARYRGAPAEDCRYLVERLCAWLNDAHLFGVGNDIASAIIRAVLAHLYLAWIHPFGDGNGRTARLVEFKILLASGVPARRRIC